MYILNSSFDKLRQILFKVLQCAERSERVQKCPEATPSRTIMSRVSMNDE
jgi:hypothetical protein